MKTTAALVTLAALSALPAQAEYFRPHHGTSFGLSINSGHRHHGRHFANSSYDSHRYGHFGYRPYFGYPYSAPVYYSTPRYAGTYYDSAYPATRSSRASNGLILGGIAGAIVGHNSGDLRNNAWRGAAIGAGAGWLLGAIADNRAEARERAAGPAPLSQPTVSNPEYAAALAPAAPAAAPQTVIINNNYYGSTNAMSSANALFGR